MPYNFPSLNGFVWRNVQLGNYILTAKATDNDGLVTTSAPVHISVARNKPSSVSIINPANHETFPSPAVIHLKAAAKDPDGRITKVEFYNGTTLLRTERKLPYTYAWRHVPVGNYNITARATDNWGAVTTSAVVNISVEPNKAPSVSIINPANGESFTAPATIHMEAAAKDPDNRIIKVEFYNGSSLLRTERKLPYTYNWQDVPAGTYTITAVASDNYGKKTTSAPVMIMVGSMPLITTNIKSSQNNEAKIKDLPGIKLSPNPAKNILNIYTNGLKQNKPLTISVISASGIIMKTLRSNSSTEKIQLDVSSYGSGVYAVKIISGERIRYRQFVKL